LCRTEGFGQEQRVVYTVGFGYVERSTLYVLGRATNFICFGWIERFRVSLLSPLCFHFFAHRAVFVHTQPHPLRYITCDISPPSLPPFFPIHSGGQLHPLVRVLTSVLITSTTTTIRSFSSLLTSFPCVPLFTTSALLVCSSES